MTSLATRSRILKGFAGYPRFVSDFERYPVLERPDAAVFFFTQMMVTVVAVTLHSGDIARAMMKTNSFSLCILRRRRL
jgi:hypothetical protein